jgi:hypothetical protein
VDVLSELFFMPASRIIVVYSPDVDEDLACSFLCVDNCPLSSVRAGPLEAEGVKKGENKKKL